MTNRRDRFFKVLSGIFAVVGFIHTYQSQRAWNSEYEKNVLPLSSVVNASIDLFDLFSFLKFLIVYFYKCGI